MLSICRNFIGSGKLIKGADTQHVLVLISSSSIVILHILTPTLLTPKAWSKQPWATFLNL